MHQTIIIKVNITIFYLIFKKNFMAQGRLSTSPHTYYDLSKSAVKLKKPFLISIDPRFWLIVSHIFFLLSQNLQYYLFINHNHNI